MPLGKSGKYFMNPHVMKAHDDEPANPMHMAGGHELGEGGSNGKAKSYSVHHNDDGTAHSHIHHADDSHEHTDHASAEEAHDHVSKASGDDESMEGQQPPQEEEMEGAQPMNKGMVHRTNSGAY